MSFCILGLGLIGSSLARDLLNAGLSVSGYDPNVSPEETARHLPTLTIETDAETAISNAAHRNSVIVVAVPLAACPHIFSLIALLAPHNIVTDVVTVKEPLHALAKQNQITHFYGGHPLAGTEQSGISAGRQGLFQGKKWIFTRSDIPSALHTMIAGCGAKASYLSPHEHDQALALTSQLPHIFAEILSLLLIENPTGELVAASSYFDATRVALTRPELVTAMLVGNAQNVLFAIDQTHTLLTRFRDAIETATDENTSDPLNQLLATAFTAAQRRQR